MTTENRLKHQNIEEIVRRGFNNNLTCASIANQFFHRVRQ